MSTSRPLLKWKNFTIGTFAVVMGKMFLSPRLGNKIVSLNPAAEGRSCSHVNVPTQNEVNLALACLSESLRLVKESLLTNMILLAKFTFVKHMNICSTRINKAATALQEHTGSCVCVQSCQSDTLQNRTLLQSLDYVRPLRKESVPRGEEDTASAGF